MMSGRGGTVSKAGFAVTICGALQCVQCYRCVGSTGTYRITDACAYSFICKYIATGVCGMFCICGLSCAGSFAGKYITAGVWACFVRWALPISAELPREYSTNAGGLANKSIKIKKGRCGRISGVL